MKEENFPWRVEKVTFIQGTEEERMGDISEDLEKLMEDGDLLWELFQDKFIPHFDQELFLEALEEEGFEFFIDHIRIPLVVVELAVPVPRYFGEFSEDKANSKGNFSYSWGLYQTKSYVLEGESISDLKVLTPKAERLWKDVHNKEFDKWKTQNQ